MERFINLQFHGAQGYKMRFNSHKKGQVLEYPETIANQLQRDYPGSFTVVGETRITKEKGEPVVEKKEEKKPENKMVDTPSENKSISSKKEDKKPNKKPEDGRIRRRLV